MKYIMYKLSFPNGVHIGNGRINSAEITMRSDTVFSAMCIEALGIGGDDLLESLVSEVKNGKIVLSDALPYIENTFYLPKPMCRIERNSENISLKKEFKKLEYIPTEKMKEYLAGAIDPLDINGKFSKLGKRELFQKVYLKIDEDNELYSVGVYEFSNGCGLYIIFGYESEKNAELIDNIMQGLKYSGIGGKRSSGYGRFEFEKCGVDFENMINAKAERYMTVSSCMAADNELDEVLEGANYKLIKRSGFVQSATYSEKQLKKHDFYTFSAGSVFKRTFKGDVFDVAIHGNNGHSVYKYAKPMFIGIGGSV